MSRYIINRLLLTIPVLLGVSVLVFAMLHLVPGDPIMAMFAQTGASGRQIEEIKEQLGLNDPLPVQYLRFLSNAVRGDLGKSLWGERDVLDMILEALPSTIRLTIAGMGVAIILGLTLGIIAALNHNSWIDNLTMVTALAGVSIPSFWLGLMLILVFAVNLRWFPIVGQGSWKSIVLPAVALGFGASALIARMTRSELLEVMGQDYIRTARAKGLRSRIVVLRHGLKNALIPVLTIVGLQFGALLGGTVIIETVFARQGLGRIAVEALKARDFPVAQGVVLFVALIYVFVNLIVDLLYAVVDPRIRYN
ncbi:MAG: ABC transporter permease [Caldilineaceae bacterium]|nr:ABC transporter permease [Caldilineaceae bacterium]